MFLNDAQTAPLEHLSGPGGEHVIYKPIPVQLPEGRIAKETRRQEHLMSRLEHSLQMGWIALRKWQLLGERCQGHSPSDHTFFSRDFEQSVESSSNGIGK